MVEVRNLSFSYSKRRILKDVSFSVSPGETVCVVGANGAGKTTLLRIMATLAIPDCGSVLLDRQDAFARPLRYRRQLGYLPEKFSLYEDMTVKDFLHYRAALKVEPPKRVRRRVGEAVQMCSLADILRRSIRSLSAGEKKRVALADVLMLRPRLLLLDDFLAGLDCNMREMAGRILESAAAFSSVVVSGHEIEDFAKWGSRFLLLKEGRLASCICASDFGRDDLPGVIRKELSGER